MAPNEPPAWRRAFDGVERLVTPPIRSATSSPDFQIAAQRLGRAKKLVTAPVGGLASWGLQLLGLPSRSRVRDVERQLGEVQRELMSLRRELASGEPDELPPESEEPGDEEPQ